MSGITKVLEILEAAREQIKKAENRQLALWEGKGADMPLLLMANAPAGQKELLPERNLKEIHFDSEKMLEYGLREALRAISGGGDAVPSVRANMGCSVYPSLLGVTPLLFEDKMPWVKEHLTREQLSRMEPGQIVPDSDFAVALEHMHYMSRKLENSPVRIFPPDLQGPYDMAHIVYGDAIFYDMYDDPAFVHHLLDICCHAIIWGVEQSLATMPGSGEMVAHYNNVVIPRSMGGIKISEDTSTLLSPDAIDEFVVPYTSRVLEHFGGGYIHYCGKNDYLFKAMLGMEKSIGINFGDPAKHDMSMILSEIADAGKVYYGMVNALPGESEAEFFARVKGASRGRLLLNYNIGNKDTATTLSSWAGESTL